MKYFFGLPFLNPDELIDCFTEDLMSIQPADDAAIVQFTDYIFDNYISPDADFQPIIWSQFSPTCNRTTNSCESFHSKLNGSFYHHHPNIYYLTNVLKQVQSETYKN